MSDRLEDVHGSARGGNDGPMVAFCLARRCAALAGAAVVMAGRVDGGLRKDALEVIAAAAGSAQQPAFAGLSQHGSDPGGGRQGIGRADAGEVAGIAERFCAEHDPHAGQAADEGCVRLALAQRSPFAAELDRARAAYNCLRGPVREAGGPSSAQPERRSSARPQWSARARRDPPFWAIRRRAAAGGQSACCPHHRVGPASPTRSAEAAALWWPFGGEIVASLQAGNDADEQVMQARQAPALGVDWIAPPVNEQPDLAVELCSRPDRAQIPPGADLVGNGRGIAWARPVLAAAAPTGGVEGQARHLDDSEAGLGQYWLGESGDAANDVEADTHRGPGPTQVGDRGQPVLELAADVGHAPGVNRRDPRNLLGNGDPNADPYARPRQLKVGHPARAAAVGHCDRPHSLISGRGGGAGSRDLPPQRSLAGMTAAPALPPNRNPDTPGSRSQAVPEQQLDGRVA